MKPIVAKTLLLGCVLHTADAVKWWPECLSVNNEDNQDTTGLLKQEDDTTRMIRPRGAGSDSDEYHYVRRKPDGKIIPKEDDEILASADDPVHGGCLCFGGKRRAARSLRSEHRDVGDVFFEQLPDSKFFTRTVNLCEFADPVPSDDESDQANTPVTPQTPTKGDPVEVYEVTGPSNLYVSTNDQSVVYQLYVGSWGECLVALPRREFVWTTESDVKETGSQRSQHSSPSTGGLSSSNGPR